MLFIIDFDGTVAPTDTVDALLARFADPDWRRIEKEWVAGRIGSQECMASQLALVSGDRPRLARFLRSVAIDPAFPEFLRTVRPFADVAVVSDGLDYPIEHALRKLDVPIYANRMHFEGRGITITFPYANSSCTVKSGVCKCAVARSLDADRGSFTVLIGDGHSDRCIAGAVDYVFATGSLRRYCEAENIIHTPFESFGDVLTIVRGWNAREEVPRRANAPSPYRDVQ